MVQSALVGISFVRVSGPNGTQTGEDFLMMLQRCKWLGLLGVLVVAGQARVVAQERAPSKAALAEMGLSGLSVISDDDAMDIRGEGFMGGGSGASASGSSWANVSTPFGSAGTTNQYDASGKHSASGDNLSFAGFSITTSGGKDDGTHGKQPKGGDGGQGGNGGYGGMGGDNGSKSHGNKGGDGGYGGSGGSKGGKDHGSKDGDNGYGGSDGNKGGKDHGNKGGDGGYGGSGGNKGGKDHGSKGGDGGYGGSGGNKGSNGHGGYGDSGGNKSGKDHGSKGGNGGYGGNNGGKSGKGNGGGYGGGGGGGGDKGGHAPKTVTKVVFAGGSSRAHTH
jgi:hypothetical protein